MFVFVLSRIASSLLFSSLLSVNEIFSSVTPHYRFPFPSARSPAPRVFVRLAHSIPGVESRFALRDMAHCKEGAPSGAPGRNVIAVKSWSKAQPAAEEGPVKLSCRRLHVKETFMFAPAYAHPDANSSPKARTFELCLRDYEPHYVIPKVVEQESFWMSFVRDRLQWFNSLMFRWNSSYVVIH